MAASQAQQAARLYTSMLLACLALALLGAGGVAAAPSETRHVVLLYDERTELPGLAALDASLRRALAGGSAAPIEVYREAMDLSRLGSDSYLDLLREHLRRKYAGKRIDAAVAVMSPALDFLLRNRDTVFPGVPIVFCGVEKQLLGDQPLPAGVTGVFLKRAFAPTLEVALRLHPDTKQVVFVAGSSGFDARLVEEAMGELKAYESRLEFRYLTDLALPDVLAELSRLPPRTVVLYSTMFRDGAGVPFVPHEVAERISRAASAPVYGFLDQYLGRGIVGGHLYSLDAHGEQAASLALRVLAGAEPSQLAPLEPMTSRTMFDWRQLERWRISESRLPADAIVQYRAPSLWTQYGGYVVGTASVFGLQGLLIGGLLVQRSRRRRAESALKESEELHRLTLGNISDAVFITRPDGTFTFVCPNVDVIFGHDQPEVERMGNISRLLGNRVLAADALDNLRELSNVDCRILDKSGLEHDLLVNVKRIAIGEGTHLYTCRDVTDRRRAEEANRNLAHAQRLAGMGELTAMVAHEVNQPLGAILANAEAAEMLLEAEDPPLHEIREILSSIRRNDLRADEAIRRIRALLRRQEIQMAPLDLNDAVADVLRLAASDALRRHVCIRDELAPSLPLVFADRVHLQQLLLNLVFNAMDAMDEAPESEREVVVRTAPGGADTVEVSVADRGHGIPEDELRRVFESFYTTKPDGMGLGLSIARTIVETHQGRIWAENNPGGGATFRFTLRVDETGRG